MEEDMKDKKKKAPLDLDWDKLFPTQDEELKLPEIVKDSSTRPLNHSDMDADHQYSNLTDHHLSEKIHRMRSNLESFGIKLIDKGAKFREHLQRLEHERERRKFTRLEKDAEDCEEPVPVTKSITVGVSNSFREETRGTMPSQAQPISSFASSFVKNMEEDTDCREAKVFDEELSLLKNCHPQKTKDTRHFSRKRRKKDQSYTRELHFQCPSDLSKLDLSNGIQKGRGSSISSLCHNGVNLFNCFAEKDRPRKDASLSKTNTKLKKGEAIVLSDEDESHTLEETEQVDNFTECMKEAKIYYPSRDDPGSVEIHYTDLQCLSPEGFLSSTIMNFYIQYLQQQASLANKPVSDCHFFNTYFYKKLKEAVSYKGSDQDAFFMKFRRWWKGVNIFQKAYILIPIHEDLHWSLVIICIPNKEDESGPIILHLDSLGLHSSRLIFNNIKSYLRKERNYLGQEASSSDLPIADRIWKHLPRRIDEKIIKVPQQKNDYDCGLFVLFFIERFIEEAPGRLKMKDLAMFGKQWFKPEEASGLREKIRNLLVEEFHIGGNVNGTPESSSS